MRLLLIGLILLAVVAAGGAALMVKRLLDAQIEQQAQNAAEIETVEIKGVYVLVADERISIGTTLTKGKLRWQKWPDDALETIFLSSEKRDTNLMQQLVGKITRQSIAEGTPITDDMVFSRGKAGFLSGILDKGFRAVSIKVDLQSGVGGFVLPGDRVDILVTFDARQLTQGLSRSNSGNYDEGGEENGGPIDIGPAKYSTETILQGIRVLGIDQQFKEVKGEASVAKSTTLEVSPKQAEILAVARAMGKLSLTLRSKENDNSELTTKSLTTDVDFSPTLQKIVARIAEAKQRKKRADYKKTKDLPHSKAKPVEIAPKPIEPILKEVRVIRGDVQSIQKFPSK